MRVAFVCDECVSEQKRLDTKFDITLYPARILILFQSAFDQIYRFLNMSNSICKTYFTSRYDDEFEMNSERHYYQSYLRAILSGCGLACGIGSECDCPSAKASDPGTGTGDP